MKGLKRCLYGEILGEEGKRKSVRLMIMSEDLAVRYVAVLVECIQRMYQKQKFLMDVGRDEFKQVLLIL